MKPQYQIVDVRDISHAAAKRRAANVVINPNDRQQARNILLDVLKFIRMPGITCTDDQGNASRKWHYADVAWAFLWDDPASVGVKGAIARAMFVHKDLSKQFTPPFPKGPNGTESIKVKGGTVLMALP